MLAPLRWLGRLGTRAVAAVIFLEIAGPPLGEVYVGVAVFAVGFAVHQVVDRPAAEHVVSLADRRPISPNCGTGRADSTGCPHTMAYAIRTARYRYIASVGAPPPPIDPSRTRAG